LKSVSSLWSCTLPFSININSFLLIFFTFLLQHYILSNTLDIISRVFNFIIMAIHNVGIVGKHS